MAIRDQEIGGGRYGGGFGSPRANYKVYILDLGRWVKHPILDLA